MAKPVRQHTIKRPSPRVYFAHFIDHPTNFLHFLEEVALRRWGQSVDSKEGAPAVVEPDPNADAEAERRDQIAVWNTLLELYLADTADKALRVLQRDDLPCDHTHALILCSTRGFTSGLVLLWEKLDMFEDVLRFYMDREREDPTAGASKDVVRCLEKYGVQRPGLYPLVLRFLTSSPELLARHTDDLGRILEHIQEEKIMPPLAVVQVLSRNNVASVGLVKQWLLSRIKAAREEIDMVSTEHVYRSCYTHYQDRTRSSLTHTARRPSSNSSRWRICRTPSIRGCSMSRNVQPAAASSTFRVYTLCVTTATISGEWLPLAHPTPF